MSDGREDIRRAAEELAERLPDGLAPLARLAYNYRWSWLAGRSGAVRRRSTPSASSCARRTRSACSRRRPTAALRRAAADAGLLERARRARGAVDADLDAPVRPSAVDRSPPGRSRSSAPSTASTCRCRSTPAASARSPATCSRRRPTERCRWSAVGLMYRKGYFRQRIDAGGLAARVLGRHRPRAAAGGARDRRRRRAADGRRSRSATRGVTRADLARRRRPRAAVPARHRPARRTAPSQRWITARLYDGDRAHAPRPVRAARGRRRARAARRSGIEPGVIHLNEGHAALAPLELARPATARRRGPDRARSRPRASGPCSRRTRRCRPATTPTPPSRVDAASARSPPRLGLDADAARSRSVAPAPDDAGEEPFGMTQVALRSSSRAPTASAAATARSRARCGSRCGPSARADEVPIGHVTNGVHVPTWIGAPMRALLDRHLGEGWLDARGRPARPGRRSTRSPTRSCGRRAASAARATSSTACASAASLDRLRPRRRARVRRRAAAERSTPTR